jgi:hypothetical protein
MSDPVDALIVDLLEWIGTESRPYADVLDAWRTSCPRLPVWEDANDRGFIAQHYDNAQGARVSVTAVGQAYVQQRRVGRFVPD